MVTRHRTSFTLAAGFAATLAFLIPRLAAQRSSSGGSEIMSPSVVGTSYITRDANGPNTLNLLVLWRGSPGWFMRRTGRGSSMGSSGGTTYVRQGGVHLTVAFDAATRTARILDEDVPLVNGANVVLVDNVDDPSGPRVVKTLKVEGALGATGVLSHLVLDSPELLDLLRCQAQIPEPANRAAMSYVCSSAVALGRVTGDRTVTPIPEGPVTNRAADPTGPPPPSRPPGPSQGMSDRILSPAVVGGMFTHREASGSESLDLLVLWRGSPGWHLRGTDHGGSAGGMGMSGRRGMTIRYGTLSLYAAFEPATRHCQIEDKDVPLGDDNVVLVDDVDGASGLRVVKTMRIDPALPEPGRMELAIRRSPELVAFLRCDVKLPDARQQALMDIICGQVVGR